MNTPLSELDAVILAGGFGTRLQGVVRDRPKPMALVAGKPFLEYLLGDLRRQGIRRIILCTGHLSEMIRSHFGNGSRWGMEATYSHEETPLGTAGAIRQALPHIHSERFFALNGDSFCNPDLGRLHQRHLQNRARASLWLVTVGDCQRFGSVELEADGRIKAFREKAAASGAGLINAGAYLIERRQMENLPPGRKLSLETEVFPNWIDNGLFGEPGPGPFIDIGTPETYAQAERFFAGLPD